MGWGRGKQQKITFNLFVGQSYPFFFSETETTDKVLAFHQKKIFKFLPIFFYLHLQLLSKK